VYYSKNICIVPGLPGIKDSFDSITCEIRSSLLVSKVLQSTNGVKVTTSLNIAVMKRIAARDLHVGLNMQQCCSVKKTGPSSLCRHE
jgi:hypothetical protein